jgi:hypothetical protein
MLSRIRALRLDGESPKGRQNVLFSKAAAFRIRGNVRGGMHYPFNFLELLITSPSRAQKAIDELFQNT